MRRHLACSALLLALVLASACGNHGAAPHPQPSPTTSSAAATRPETAQHFIRRWIAAGNRAQASGDVAALRRLSGPHCVSCRTFIGTIRNTYKAGGRIVGGATRIRGIKHLRGFTWRLDLAAGASTIYPRATASPVHYAGGPFSQELTVARAGRGWQVARYAKH